MVTGTDTLETAIYPVFLEIKKLYDSWVNDGWDKDDIDIAFNSYATEFTILSPNSPMIRRTGKHIKNLLFHFDVNMLMYNARLIIQNNLVDFFILEKLQP